MDVAVLSRAICGTCERDVAQLANFFDRYLEEEARGLVDKIEVRETRTPLVKGIDKSVLKGLEEKYGSRRIAKYLVRRALYLKYGNSIGEYRGARCPICGLPPTLLVKSVEDIGIFSRDVYHARCTCGFKWRWDELYLCPKCSARGRENFSIYFVKDLGVRFMRCKKCGFIVAVVEQEVGQGLHVALQLLAKYVGRGQGD
jgi:Zn ribbon nucleic-acid-binding protein